MSQQKHLSKSSSNTVSTSTSRGFGYHVKQVLKASLLSLAAITGYFLVFGSGKSNAKKTLDKNSDDLVLKNNDPLTTISDLVRPARNMDPITKFADEDLDNEAHSFSLKPLKQQSLDFKSEQKVSSTLMQKNSKPEEALRKIPKSKIYSGGSGTKSDPFQISTCTELQNIARNLSANYILMNNINCTETKNWNHGAGFGSIGSYPSLFFSGVLDGKGYAVTNLYMNRPQYSASGLFANIKNAKISNIGLVNVNIYSRISGALAAHVTNSVISNTYSTGEINASGPSGGLMGWVHQENPTGRMTGCHSGVNLLSTGGATGGLIGANQGLEIMNSYATGSIKLRGSVFPSAGGLVGENSFSGKIFASYATGTVSSNLWAGGLVGQNYGGCSKCSGGVIVNSYASGPVTVVPMPGKTQYGGGLVGLTWNGKSGGNSIIKNCYALGRVSSENLQTSMTGGLVGRDTYGRGSRTQILNSYYDLSTTGQHDTGKGIPKTTAQMKRQSTYRGWDFYDVWQINDGVSYPVFRKVPFSIVFSNIPSPQKIKVPFIIKVIAGDRAFNGGLSFYSTRGEVSPEYVNMMNGIWSGNVTLHSVGRSNSLQLRWYSPSDSRTSMSNLFNVLDQNNKIPNNSTIIGAVTDIFQNPIINASVQIKSNGGSTYKALTDKYGKYEVADLLIDSFSINVQKNGYKNGSLVVDTALGRKVTGNLLLNRMCKKSDYANGKVPILLIPGIMGSSRSDGHDIYPRLLEESPSWDTGKLQIHNPFDKLGWNKLRNGLISMGYKEGCTLHDVSYDWSLPIVQIRDRYLIPWVNHIKKISNADKVDIIAHSMGGLVTRSYVQSNLYADDVRKFTMVGTPNKGADMSYYMWEGADPINADITAGSDKLLWPGMYFYTNTIFYAYEVRRKGSVCDFGYFFRYTPSSCRHDDLYDFLHNDGISSGQLMPIYDNALLDNLGKSTYIVKEENTFLRALNGLGCRNPEGCIDRDGELYSFKPPSSVFSATSSKVQTMLFVGTGHKTVESIYVLPQPPNYSGELYKDGAPLDKRTPLKATGDGTVLRDSVIFNDYFPSGGKLPVLEQPGEHAELIGLFSNQITEFITGKKVPPNLLSIKSERGRAFAIIIDGRIQPSISGPKNVSVVKGLSLKHSGLHVRNVIDGQYKITFNSPYSENYEVSVMYYDFNKKVFDGVRSMGYFDNTLQSFNITVNQKLINNTVQFDRSFSSPYDLDIRNVTQNTVLLVWKDPIGSKNRDVDHYEIFSKRKYEPYYSFFARTVSTEQKHPVKASWKQAVLNDYAVRSILKSKRSTFFSPPIWRNTTSYELPSSKSMKSNSLN